MRRIWGDKFDLRVNLRIFWKSLVLKSNIIWVEGFGVLRGSSNWGGIKGEMLMIYGGFIRRRDVGM